MSVLRTISGQTAAQYCRENNVSYGMFIHYLNKIGDVDEAIKMAEGPRVGPSKNCSKHYYKGEYLKDICDAHDRNTYFRIMNRAFRLKISVEESVNIENEKRNNLIENCYTNYIKHKGE